MLKMRHYDVQLMAAWSFTRAPSPRCARAKARRWWRPCPSYLTRSRAKAFTAHHRDDYLAKRDADGWTLYRWMWLSIGTIVNQQSDEEKRARTAPTSATPEQRVGFDYLLDNMKSSALEYLSVR